MSKDEVNIELGAGISSLVGKGAAVLVVDDSDTIRKIVVRILGSLGLKADEAGDGLEALEYLKRQTYTLVISDVNMPRLNGRELLARVGQEYPDIGVVMITGTMEVELAVECLTAGAMDFIIKPFVLGEVKMRLTRALERQILVLQNKQHQVLLEARVSEQAVRLQTIFLGGVGALVEALEAKDMYTHGHSGRVGKLACMIGRQLGWGEEERNQLQMAGHLHDIGKIGVKEEILNKEGKLTEEEYAHVMTHTTIGWKILRSIFEDQPLVLNVVRWHHERLDGAGTPDRLVGDKIPLEARIVAVADAFDAMTSDRPYREGRCPLEALAELKRVSGKQVDGGLVEILGGIIERGEIKPSNPTSEHWSARYVGQSVASRPDRTQ